MERETRLALVFGGIVVLLGTLVAVSYGQMMSGQNWFGQMMNNSGGMGMNNGGMSMNCGDHMGGMGGMMSGMGNNCQGNGSGPGNYSAANTVAISNYSFGPQTLNGRVGTTVTWINMDNVAHSVVSGTPAGPFESPLLDHMQSFSYTFSTPGTFTYHCGPHPYMTGTIVVG